MGSCPFDGCRGASIKKVCIPIMRQREITLLLFRRLPICLAGCVNFPQKHPNSFVVRLDFCLFFFLVGVFRFQRRFYPSVSFSLSLSIPALVCLCSHVLIAHSNLMREHGEYCVALRLLCCCDRKCTFLSDFCNSNVYLDVVMHKSKPCIAHHRGRSRFLTS